MHHGKRVSSIRPPRFHDPFTDGSIDCSDEPSIVLSDPDHRIDIAPFAGAGPVAVCSYRPSYDRLADRGMQVRTDLPDACDIAVAFVPRNRVQALGRIAELLRRIRPGGWLVVDGAKTDGIDPILKALDKEVPLSGRVSRDHGKAGWVQRPEVLPDGLSDWITAAQPVITSNGLASAPGMFSVGKIDPGTQALLAALPADIRGRVADYGAGWGALSHGLLSDNPKIASLDVIEADHASAEAAKENLADARARVHWADVTQWPGGPYDTIVTNPPFHASRTGDPGLGAAFIEAAARGLAPKGTLYLVANRHLPYERTLDALFRDRVELGSDPAYKVYRASRPVGSNRNRRY